jgi:thiol-disulfide isomerase/thioredoxin
MQQSRIRRHDGNAGAGASAASLVTAGLAALLAALVVATGAGLFWKATNGRMRQVGRPAGLGADGTGPPAPPDTQAPAPAVVSATDLGQALGERATLLQFSSAFCAPCRATRRILADVAGRAQGVAHIEVDAESRLDLVRANHVLRTPTVLVLAADGRVVHRASGQPRKDDVIGALGDALAGASIPHSSGREAR